MGDDSHCLVCVKRIKKCPKRKSFGSDYDETKDDGRLLRKLLIFGEKRLKVNLEDSVISAFLHTADYQRFNFQPPKILTTRRKKTENEVGVGVGVEKLFCSECAEIVANLCELFENIRTMETMVDRWLQELGNNFQDLRSQVQSSSSKKSKSRPKNDVGLRMKQRKLALQIVNLLSLDVDTKAHEGQGQLQVKQLTGLRELLGCHVREHLQEKDAPVPATEENIRFELGDLDIDPEPEPHETDDDWPIDPPDSSSKLPCDSVDVDNEPEAAGPSPMLIEPVDDHDDEDFGTGCETGAADENDDNVEAGGELETAAVADEEDDDEIIPDEDDTDWTPDVPRYKRKAEAISTLELSPESPKRQGQPEPPVKKRRSRRGGGQGSRSPSPPLPPLPHPYSKGPRGKPQTNKEVEEDVPKTRRAPVEEEMTEDERRWYNRPCGLCGRQYLSGFSLMSHMKNVHEKYAIKRLRRSGELPTFVKFQCPFCPVTESYYEEESLLVHMEHWDSHHEYRCSRDCRFRCDRCDTVNYATLDDLTNHLQSDHRGEATFKCSKCPWTFLQENARDFHETLHVAVKLTGGGTKRVLQCPGCPLTFVGNTTLAKFQSHFSENHADNFAAYGCLQCGKKYCSMAYLKVHQKVVHEHAALVASIEGEGDFFCENCPKRFKTHQQLQAHVSKCRSKHQCDVCEKRFADLPDLLRHLTKDHFPEGRFTCPEEGCGKIFQIEASFKGHLKRHRIEKEAASSHQDNDGQPLFVCPHCPKTFKVSGSYRAHLSVVHSLETRGVERKKSEICDECGAAYYSANELKIHKSAKHPTDETEMFLCPICERAFPVQSWMLSHIKSKHKLDWRDVVGNGKITSGHLNRALTIPTIKYADAKVNIKKGTTDKKKKPTSK